MQFEEFNDNVIKCIKFLNGDDEELMNSEYNDLCCKEETLYEMYQRDNKEAMTEIFNYTFCTEYFNNIQLNMDVISVQPIFIQQIIAKSYILKHRENNEGRIKFLANFNNDKEYLKYINTCEEYFQLIDVIDELTIQAHNPYKLFNKDIVDEIITEVMDFEEPILDTEREEQWNTLKESVKNINENEISEYEKSKMMRELLMGGVGVISETLKNNTKMPY